MKYIWSIDRNLGALVGTSYTVHKSISVVTNYSFDMEYKYLISRLADPVIALSIGAAAYYVHERRVGRAEGHTLNELLRKKYGK